MDTEIHKILYSNQNSFNFRKTNIPKEINQESLKECVEILEVNNIDYCVVWGTELGLVRDSCLIDGDDDIDLMVNVKDFEKVVKAFYRKKYIFAPTCRHARFTHPDFLKVLKVRENISCFVDFYFYYDEHPYYVEGFYYGDWESKEEKIKNKTFLRFPKDIFFPFKQKNINNIEVSLPNNPELAAEWSYGKKWRENLIKNQDYKWEVINHAPKITYL